MNILYISPLNQANPHLFPKLKRTFSENDIRETTNPNDCTHLFLDTISGKVEYDHNVLSIILERDIPVVCFVNKEFGTMQKERWFLFRGINDAKTEDEIFMWNAIGKSTPIIYFLRNMDKREEYPDNVYPFDWSYFTDCDFPITTKEELFSREYDIVFIGTESPTRKNMIDAIVRDGRLKVFYEFRDHTKRIPHNDWINGHRKGKLYLSADGGGFTEERPNQLFAVSVRLKNVNNHAPHNPFTDGINCIEIPEKPNEEDIEKVVDILNDKEWLWSIYKSAINFTKGKYSEESNSNYVLDVLKKENVIGV